MSGKDPVKLDDEQLAELREIFSSFDRNKDGGLTQLELGSLLRSLGLKLSRDQLEALIQKADTNDNGLIEFSEFIALVEPDLVQTKCPYTEDQLRKIFRMFDRDGNGYITPAELAHSMAKLGHALTAEELSGMMKEADGNGYITPAELAHSMAKLGHALTAEELSGMMKEADGDGDGCIDFQEFAQAITSAAFDNFWL